MLDQVRGCDHVMHWHTPSLKASLGEGFHDCSLVAKIHAQTAMFFRYQNAEHPKLASSQPGITIYLLVLIPAFDRLRWRSCVQKRSEAILKNRKSFVILREHGLFHH